MQQALFDSFGAIKPAPADNELHDLIQRLPQQLYLGTSSWSFPGWSGLVFADNYSKSALSKHGLFAYASHELFRTVSLDRTYYAPMAEPDLARYAAQTDLNFRFVVKAFRDLTEPRQKGKRNPYFLDVDFAKRVVLEPLQATLDQRLGTVLLQFSPNSSNLFVRYQDLFFQRLQSFLAAFDQQIQFSVEVRNGQLFSPPLLELLQRYQAIPCITVHPAMPDLPSQLAAIRADDWPALSVRWNLGHGQAYDQALDRYDPFDKLVDEDLISRQAATHTAADFLTAGKPVSIIVNNKAEGSAPLSIRKLAESIDAKLRTLS